MIEFGDEQTAFEMRAELAKMQREYLIEGDGVDNFFRLIFKYLLLIDAGRDEIIATYKIKEGLLESNPSGGISLIPFKSGRSFPERSDNRCYFRGSDRRYEKTGSEAEPATSTTAVGAG